MNKREIKHLRWAIAVDQLFATARKQDDAAYLAWLEALGLEPVAQAREIRQEPLKARQDR